MIRHFVDNRNLAPAEELLDFGMAELHPRRAAVVALPRTRRDFHFSKQRIHLRDRENAASAHRAMAGDRSGDVIEPIAKPERAAELGDLPGEVRDQPGNVGLAERSRNRPDENRRWTEPF